MKPIVQHRISLRLFEENDITKEYISWLNDPEVVKHSNQRFMVHSYESCKSYYESFLNSDNLFFVISHNETNEVLGTMTVYFSINHSTADIGIMVGNKDFWGMGLGEEAWKGLMEFLLNELNIRKVTGGTLSSNKGMIRIFEKVGMMPDGVRKDHEIINGIPHDIVYFAKFRS
jgi:ribosomal-protein-alanine N-acetyltransferase